MEMIATNKSNDARDPSNRALSFFDLCDRYPVICLQERVDFPAHPLLLDPRRKRFHRMPGRHFAAAQAAEARLDLQTAVREYEAAIRDRAPVG